MSLSRRHIQKKGSIHSVENNRRTSRPKKYASRSFSLTPFPKYFWKNKNTRLWGLEIRLHLFFSPIYGKPPVISMMTYYLTTSIASILPDHTLTRIEKIFCQLKTCIAFPTKGGEPTTQNNAVWTGASIIKASPTTTIGYHTNT